MRKAGGERKLRIIPKKIKVKNTVWKCYSMPDVIVALAMFALIFAFITLGNWVLAVILGIVSVVMFMPTQEGIFYACILENIKFVFAKKRYTANAKSMKENVDVLIPLKGIKENGLVHLSQLADRFISDPNEVVSIHQHIRVKVLSIDMDRKRIQLTMKGVEQN